MVDMRSSPARESIAGSRLALSRLPATAGSPIRIATRSLPECLAFEIRSGFCGAVRVSLRLGASARFELAAAPPSHFYRRIAHPALVARPPGLATRTRRRPVQKPPPRGPPLVDLAQL